jgi:hypothetical protein
MQVTVRSMPGRDTIVIPRCSTMSTDPRVQDVNKPFSAPNIGMDCAIRLVGDRDRTAFDWSSPCGLGPVPAVLKGRDLRSAAPLTGERASAGPSGDTLPWRNRPRRTGMACAC